MAFTGEIEGDNVTPTRAFTHGTQNIHGVAYLGVRPAGNESHAFNVAEYGSLADSTHES